jgi:hypothetical protein
VFSYRPLSRSALPSSAAISKLVLRVLCDLSVAFAGLPAMVETTRYCELNNGVNVATVRRSIPFSPLVSAADRSGPGDEAFNNLVGV